LHWLLDSIRCPPVLSMHTIAAQERMEESPRKRFSMRGYTARKYLLAVFISVYGIVAYWGGEASRRGEFFPVFNWSLFTHIYSLQTLPELHIVSLGGQKFPKPVNYFELPTHFESARLRASVVPKTVAQLYRAILRDDQAEIARLRRIIELRHLKGHGEVEYEICVVRFMAVDRWKNRDHIIDQNVVARFKSGGH
jgi:hypothetical protein